MDFRGSFVPPEILLAIVKLVSRRDISNLRQVCKTLNEYSTRFLIRRVYLSTHWKDRENLTRISQHPVLSKSVREIVYDATNYEDYWLDLCYYQEFFGGGKSPCIGEQSYTKISVTRGHALYKQAYSDQAMLAEYCKPFLTRSMDNDTRPSDFEAMLFDPQCLYQVAEFLPDDLLRLVRALPRMPNVTHVTLSDCRWTKHRNRYHHLDDWAPATSPEYTFAIQNEGSKGLEAVVLDPRPWPNPHEDFPPMHDRDRYRGFRVITQALAMTRNRSVTHFAVKRGQSSSGLAWEMFDVPLREGRALSISFRHLKSIVLKFDTSKANGRVTQNSKSFLPSCLASAMGLEQLTIELEEDVRGIDTTAISFIGLVGHHHWERLRSVSFAHVTFPIKEFLDFLLRHHHSLRSLALESVFMALEPRASATDRESLYQEGILFRSMALCKLNLETLTVQTGTYYPMTRSWYHACNADDVLKLLHSEGQWCQERPLVRCSHDVNYHLHARDV
ncbi:MAG: hypothetical protein Q9225_007613 [Loekoesia sp. 1 TL-2023]